MTFYGKKFSTKFGKKRRALTAQQAVRGTAYVDRNTHTLIRRLRAGSVAIIDHPDIDSASAQALVETGVSAVLDAAPATSGRYPNLGPEVLLGADVLLVDNLGSHVMDIPEGSEVSINADGDVSVDGELVAQGRVQSAESNAANLQLARAGLPLQLKALASNMMDYIDAEQALILDGAGIPEVRAHIAGRQVLIVMRGYHYRDELKALRHYIREYQPIIIGVDAGADAVLEAGHHLDLIVGDMDAVSEKALTSGAELVVCSSREGRADGEKRLHDLGLPHVVFRTAGTSEDSAVMLADACGADVIVMVGSYRTFGEILDRGRQGMVCAIVTHMRVGAKLVSADALAHVYRSRISNWQLALFILAGVAAIGSAMIATAAGGVTLSIASSWVTAITSWLGNVF
ncbi:MAG: putative cytokinetic ring protein SteA [Actinomycetaceae bacterium]|nr:putative cytokinetic ring protein SteA [Actinomycetaceae bacterium]